MDRPDLYTILDFIALNDFEFRIINFVWLMIVCFQRPHKSYQQLSGYRVDGTIDFDIPLGSHNIQSKSLLKLIVLFFKNFYTSHPLM